MDKVHHSSEKMDWETPDSIYAPLHDEFDFGLDVACSLTNCKSKLGLYVGEYDGLDSEWNGCRILGQACWMNPPYGRIELPKWIQKAWDEKQKGVTTVCLVPARTDTRWWAIFWDHVNHRPRDPRDEVRFVKGRIKFVGADNVAPFPSAIVVLRGVEALEWCGKCSAFRDTRDSCLWGRSCALLKENTVEGVQS